MQILVLITPPPKKKKCSDFLILGRKEGVKKNTKISIFLDAIASLPRFGV